MRDLGAFAVVTSGITIVISIASHAPSDVWVGCGMGALFIAGVALLAYPQRSRVRGPSLEELERRSDWHVKEGEKR